MVLPQLLLLSSGSVWWVQLFKWSPFGHLHCCCQSPLPGFQMHSAHICAGLLCYLLHLGVADTPLEWTASALSRFFWPQACNLIPQNHDENTRSQGAAWWRSSGAVWGCRGCLLASGIHDNLWCIRRGLWACCRGNTYFEIGCHSGGAQRVLGNRKLLSVGQLFWLNSSMGSIRWGPELGRTSMHHQCVYWACYSILAWCFGMKANSCMLWQNWHQ